jgi:hypothetical protein
MQTYLQARGFSTAEYVEKDDLRRKVQRVMEDAQEVAAETSSSLLALMNRLGMDFEDFIAEHVDFVCKRCVFKYPLVAAYTLDCPESLDGYAKSLQARNDEEKQAQPAGTSREPAPAPPTNPFASPSVCTRPKLSEEQVAALRGHDSFVAGDFRDRMCRCDACIALLTKDNMLFMLTKEEMTDLHYNNDAEEEEDKEEERRQALTSPSAPPSSSCTSSASSSNPASASSANSGDGLPNPKRRKLTN